jgi:hypothetical protein
MKIPVPNARVRQDGFAVVILLAMVILILAFLAGNDVTLRSLKREVQLIERKQLMRYPPGHATNRVAVIEPGQATNRVAVATAPAGHVP